MQINLTKFDVEHILHALDFYAKLGFRGIEDTEKQQKCFEIDNLINRLNYKLDIEKVVGGK